MLPTDKDPCGLLRGPAVEHCERVHGDIPPSEGTGGGGGGGLTDGASDHVKDLADTLIHALRGLLAPNKAWAPEKADTPVYATFMWLGQHLAVAIFTCVVVVCALTAWQGAPRLRQMGASTGWTLAAVAGMASVPGAVMLLNQAVSRGFEAAFNSNEGTLLTVIAKDLDTGADSGNPLAILIIVSALVVALAFASLVFMCRQLGILVFVCVAPLVLASLARGGDTAAVKAWAMRLLGLMFAPFALLLVAPFVSFVEGSLVMDAVLLVAADALMLRMIFHGIPYIGPRLARGARSFVEQRTTNPVAHAVVRAGAPAFHEQENVPRGPRLVHTPGRAMTQDRSALLGAYGIKQKARPGRLTTASAISQTQRDAGRSQQLMAARRQARAAAQPPVPTGAGAPAPPRPPSSPPPSPAPPRGP